MNINISIDTLKEEFQKRKFFISDKNLFMLYSALHQKPVGGAFLFGPAGVGKTEVAQIIGDILNTEIFYYQMFPNSKEEDLLIRFGINEQGEVISLDGVLVETAKYLEENPNKCATLILDEYDKSRPSADNFLLDVLQNGRIRYAGRKYNIDLNRLIIFIISNNFREFSEPFLRRLPRIDIELLSPDLVINILKSKYNIQDKNILKLAHLLYTAGLNTELTKPITVQELNQFITAYQILGEKADIESLIYSYLVKNPEEFAVYIESLKNFNYSYQNQSDVDNSDDNDEDISDIIEKKIETKNIDIDEIKEKLFAPKFPKINSDVIFPSVVPQVIQDKKEKLFYGAIPYSDRAYNSLTNLFINMNKNVEKHNFDDIFMISDVDGEKYILQKKCFEIDNLYERLNLVTEICDVDILGNNGTLFLLHKFELVPIDFKIFVRNLLFEFDMNKQQNNFNAEVVYLSENDKQLRVKIYHYREEKFSIDSFIYLENNFVVNELIVYGNCNKYIADNYFRSIYDAQKEIYSKYMKKNENNKEILQKVIEQKHSVIKELWNKFKPVEVINSTNVKIFVFDLSEHYEQIIEKQLKTKSYQNNKFFEQEIQEMLKLFPNKFVLVMERNQVFFKRSIRFSFMIDVNDGYEKYIELFNKSVIFDLKPIEDNDFRFNMYLYSYSENKFINEFKNRFIYDDTLTYVKTLLCYKNNKSETETDKYAKFVGVLDQHIYSSTNSLSYSQLENDVIYNFLTFLETMIIATFEYRLKDIYNKYFEKNTIFDNVNHSALTNGACTRRQT